MIYENVSREMALLVKETEMLPEYTPLFLSDIGGRVLLSRNLKAEKDDFMSVSRIISESEREKYLAQREVRDCLVMTLRTNPKDLLVLTKTESDVLRGVVCSYSENNCIKLSDYFEKLCSYRDYLDSLARFSVMPQIHMPTLRLFEVRMGGAAQLLELCRMNFDNSEFVTFPLCLVAERIAGFVKSVSENPAIHIDFLCDEDRGVKVPLDFLGLLVSCISLAIRRSRDAHIKIGTQNSDSRHSFLIIETPMAVSGKQPDIYEDAVMNALANMGFGCNISKSDGLYSLQIKLETAELKKEVLAETDELSEMLSRIFTESNISELVFTILP